MGELTAADVALWTSGRLPDDLGDGGTTRMLTAALAVARREAGWHVSPSRTETIFFDAPRSAQLPIPSRKVSAIAEVVDGDGSTTQSAAITWSRGDTGRDRPVSARKRSGARWSGGYGVEVTLTHGYTEIEAADWREAILSMVDQMSTMPIDDAIGKNELGLQSVQVDDVTYRWAMAAAEASIFSATSVIDKYRLPDLEFM